MSYLVKAEPKIEPEDSLADLEGITDLLPIQTGIKGIIDLLLYRSRQVYRGLLIQFIYDVTAKPNFWFKKISF